MLPGDQYSESSQSHDDEFLVAPIAILYAALVGRVEDTLHHITSHRIISYRIISYHILLLFVIIFYINLFLNVCISQYCLETNEEKKKKKEDTILLYRTDTILCVLVCCDSPVPRHHMTMNEPEQDWFDFPRRTSILESLH